MPDRVTRATLERGGVEQIERRSDFECTDRSQQVELLDRRPLGTASGVVCLCMNEQWRTKRLTESEFQAKLHSKREVDLRSADLSLSLPLSRASQFTGPQSIDVVFRPPCRLPAVIQLRQQCPQS